MRSRRDMLTWVLAAPLALATGCKRKRKWAPPEPMAEQAFPTSITFDAAGSDTQLLTGFYPVEETWRWTKKGFSVGLCRPRNAAEKVPAIVLTFNVPEVVLQKLKSVTLYASVNGLPLPSETYTKSDDY